MRLWKEGFVLLCLLSVALMMAAVVGYSAPEKGGKPLPIEKQLAQEYQTLLDRQVAGLQLSPFEKDRLEQLRAQFQVQPRGINPLDNQGGPDAFGYFYMDNVAPDTATYNWIELRGDPQATWINSWTSHDDGYATTPAPIGFAFPFYGQSYTQFTATTNGQIEFTNPSGSYYWSCAPEPGLGALIMADMYDAHIDYGGQPGGIDVVGYRNFGNYTVIEYDSIGRCCSGGTSVKFQVILYNTGRIKLQYNQQVLNGGTMGSVAIQNQNATTSLVYRCQADGNAFRPITDGLAIWWFQPNGIPVPAANLQAQATGSTVTLTWTDPTQDTNGNPIIVDSVQVWWGPVGSGVRVGVVNPGVQTFVHTNVPDGNHTYSIRPYNDSYGATPTSVNVIVGNPAYNNDFETNNGAWSPSPANGGWEWGVPAGVTPHSGSNVWGTVLSGNYPNSACFYLDLNVGMVVLSPTATVEYWQWYESEQSFDGCHFKVSTDGGNTWELITPVGGYPQPSVFSNNCIGQNTPSWAGNSGGWQQVVLPIGAYLGQTPILRFVFGSDGSVVYPGYYFDDMTIWGMGTVADGPPQPVTNFQGQVNGTAVTLTWIDPTQDVFQNPITVDSVQLWLGPAGTGTRLGAVGPGVQTFVQPNAPNGNLTYTARPYNNGFPGTSTSIVVLVGNPSYDSNFDTDNGDFVADPETGFQWGAPNGVAPHSAPNVWGAGLGGSYPNQANFYVTLTPEQPITSAAATVEVFINYITENWWDGANFQISIDEGSTWQIVNPVGGYPEQSMWNGEPGWTGNSGGWIPIVLPIGEWNGEVPQFRFHFASDGSVTMTGFYFDDMLIWGLAPPVFTSVSGTVTLDGLGGNITQVLVRANGIGSPQTNPAANGTYTLTNVLVGDRRILASLPGFHTDTLLVTVPAGGYTGANLVLRRLNPPAPTGLTGSVNNATGIVTLNWDNSTDPQVDFYRVYRKLSSDQNWVLDDIRTTSDDVDTLTVDGIYMYAVTAVDDDVVPPVVESDRSLPVTVLFGELPPGGISASGSFDDRIRLNWLSPGVHPSYQLMYDDSSSEAFYVVQFPNGDNDYFAVRFTPPSSDTTAYPLPIQSVHLYEQTNQALPNVMVCADQGGEPNMANPLISWQNVSADDSPGWLSVNADGAVMLDTDADFWVVWQFPAGIDGPGTGSDGNAPDSRSYWTGAWAWPQWQLWTAHDWMARVWVGGSSGWGFVMSVGEPSGYSIDRIPFEQASPTAEMMKMSQSPNVPGSQRSIGPVRQDGKSKAITAEEYRFPLSFEPRFDQPYSQAPDLVYQERPRGNSLDDVVYYKIYRNNVFLANDSLPPYDDIVGSNNENVPYNYFVTAYYDNNEESASTDTVQARANMAPGAPTNVNGNPVGSTQMQITWTNPTVNADGTPCVDLATLAIYRNGALIGTVQSNVQQYIDTPPQPDMFYTWTVRARDEVPNEGAGASYTGAVTSPWETVDFDWVDISGNGTPVVQCDDCNQGPFPLGFSFEYYGQTYTEIRICSNGWLSFTASSSWLDLQCPIPAPGDPDNALFAFLDDLLPSSGQCKYYADAANERFIVSWINCPHYGSGEQYTFQVILESDGSITYNYHTIPIANSAVIGLEDQTGANGLELNCHGTGPFTPANNTAVRFWGGPSGLLEGVVRQQTGNAPILGVMVQPQEVPDFAMTDANGFYSLPLDPGTYTICYTHQGHCDTCITNILIEDGGTTVRNVTMRAPQAAFSVTSITVATWPGHDLSTTFEISNPAGQCPLVYAITDTAAWLSTSPAQGQVPPNQSATITVNMSVQGMAPGTEHTASLVVTHRANGSPRVIPVTISVSTEADPQASLPTEHALYQNYPNPFNAQTSVRFDLPQEAAVKLVLYNVAGQAVATVADGTYPAGRHTLNFEARDLPSGMYLLRIETGGYAAMKKMLLLK